MVLRRATPRGNFHSKRDGMRPAAIRCRESFLLSSRKQVAGSAVEGEEPLLGYCLRLDCAVVHDMPDRKASSGDVPRHRSAHIRQTHDRAAASSK